MYLFTIICVLSFSLANDRLFEKKDPENKSLKLFKNSFLMKQMCDSIPRINLYK